MYKVFVNDKEVFLTPSCDIERLSDQMLYMRYDDFEELHFIITMLEDSSLQGAVIYGENFELLWADFRAHFREVEAAGGIVRNDRNELLLIHRLGMWDLPKGKLEPGESAVEGAAREVMEECGIAKLETGASLPETYHAYTINGVRYLKKTYWYHMHTSQHQLTPQHDEGIQLATWKKPHEIDWNRMPTYRSIRHLLDSEVLTDLP